MDIVVAQEIGASLYGCVVIGGLFLGFRLGEIEKYDIQVLVLAYQAKCAEGKGIRLDYYVGGQIKGGYIDMGAAGAIVGAGAAAGIEAKMKNAPIAFSFDFRPGYGCLLGNDGMGNIGAFHTFDWTLNLGVRYTF
jgi:hypothetical protein